MATFPPHLDSSRTDIVVVGHFVPDDFLPEKLVAAGAVTASHVKSAKFKSLLPGQVVEFELEWGSLQVVPQRLIVQTTKAPYVRAADLAIKMIREVSKSPALSMLGINREYAYRFLSFAARNQLGMRLSPPGAWGTWGNAIKEDIESGDPNRQSGVVTIAMRQQRAGDREAGWIETTAWPTGVDATDVGVGVRVNDHYQISERNDPDILSSDNHGASRTARLLDSLALNFDESIKRSDLIVNGLINQ